MKKILLSFSLFVFGIMSVMGFVTPAFAATNVVTESDTNWSTADTRPGGNVSFETDPTSLFGSGSLLLTTDSTNTAKAQFLTTLHAGSPLSDVTSLLYWTKQEPSHAGFVAGLPSFQLEIDADGVFSPVGNSGYTTMVYEPYNNFGNSAVQNNLWQTWDVDSGTMWSSRNVDELTAGEGGLIAGAGGPPFYSLQVLKDKYPNAIVLRVGVNIGTFNPNYVVSTDGLTFNDEVYDFEPSLTPETKDQCKFGGWEQFNDPFFKNQGDCVSYVASQGKAKGNPILNLFRSLFN